MSTPTIPQPKYPGGGPYGQMPNFIPLNIGSPGSQYSAGSGGTAGTGIIGGAQSQDIAAQQLMMQNFAAMYPQVNAAQSQYQGMLGQSNINAQKGMQAQVGSMRNIGNMASNITSMAPNIARTAATVGGLGSDVGLLGAETSGLGSRFVSSTPSAQNMSGAFNTLNNASKGIYSNPKLQAAYGTLTGEASGTQPINPIVQQQMMQSGLTNAAQNLAPTSLGTGQTGEAEVAQNFGQSAESYIQNMQNQGLQGLQQLNTDVQQPAMNYLSSAQAQGNLASNILGQSGNLLGESGNLFGESGNLYSSSGNMYQNAANLYQAKAGIGSNLVTQNNQLEAEQGQMFPKTQIGLTGTDMANMMVSNTMGQNQFNQANFASQMAAAQYNSSINAQNAGLQGSSSSGLLSAGAGVASAAVIAAFCGLAISILGTTTRQWLGFRHWIHNHAPREFRSAYFRALREPKRYRRSAFVRSAISRIADKYSREYSFPRGWLVPA